jgi:zinc transport system permease protein
VLEFAFMQRALVAAILVGTVCGTLGFFVILRRLAFIGVGISHSAIGGVAIGLLLGIDPLLTAGIFAIAVALGIAGVRRRAQLSEDAVIGVFFSGSMALGIVLFSMNHGYQQDLFGYLFGNVLALSTRELYLIAGTGVLVVGILAIKLRELLFIAFDEEVARAYGRPVDFLNSLLMVLIAVTVIIGVRLVGVLLIEALLVVPAATAALWAGNFRSQMVLSAVLGAACGIAGLAAAYWLDIAAGGSIVLATVTLFFASVVLRGRRAS